jgi:hypothetical protein
LRSDCVAVIEEAELYQGKDSGTYFHYPIILSSRLCSKEELDYVCLPEYRDPPLQRGGIR